MDSLDDFGQTLAEQRVKECFFRIKVKARATTRVHRGLAFSRWRALGDKKYPTRIPTWHRWFCFDPVMIDRCALWWSKLTQDNFTNLADSFLQQSPRLRKTIVQQCKHFLSPSHIPVATTKALTVKRNRNSRLFLSTSTQKAMARAKMFPKSTKKKKRSRAGHINFLWLWM